MRSRRATTRHTRRMRMDDVIRALTDLIVAPESLLKEALGSWSAVHLPETRLALQTQGVAPLLGHKARLAGFPESFHRQIRRYLEEQAEHNSIRVKRIKALRQKIFQISVANKVAIIPLKGSVLIDQIYAEPAERIMADIDLLVTPEDTKIMEVHLASLGYRLSKISEEHWLFDQGGRILTLDGEHADNPVNIELHDHLAWQAGQWSSDLAAFVWQTAEKGSGVFSGIEIPSPVAMRLMLLCHAAKHLFANNLRLIQLYDIRLCLADTDPDEWQSLLDAAARLEIEPMVYAGLFTSCRLVHAQVPHSVLEHLARQTPRQLRRHLRSQSFFSMNAINDDMTLRFLLDARPNRYTAVLLWMYSLCLRSHLNCMRLNWYPNKRICWPERLSLLATSPFHSKARSRLVAYLRRGLLLPFQLLLLLPFLLCGQAFRGHLLELFRHRLLDRLMPAV